jgi:hypothetical protein
MVRSRPREAERRGWSVQDQVAQVGHAGQAWLNQSVSRLGVQVIDQWVYHPR